MELRLGNLNTKRIVALLVTSLLLFSVAFVAADWSLARWQRKAVRENYVELLFAGLAGGPLKFAELYNVSFTNQFLRLQAARFNALQETVLDEIRILGGPDGSESYGYWRRDSAPLASECREVESRRFQPEHAVFAFVVEVVTDACAPIPLERRMRTLTLSFPLVACAILLAVLGGIMAVMLLSVSRARGLLAFCDDGSEVLQGTSRIPWEEVRLMAERAIRTEGRNLNYFTTLVAEVEHDASKVVQRLRSRAPASGKSAWADDLSALERILHQLVSHTCSEHADGDEEESGRLAGEEAAATLERVLGDCAEMDFHLPQASLRLPLGRVAFERLCFNLRANFVKHQGHRPHIVTECRDERFRVSCERQIPLLAALKLRAAGRFGLIHASTTARPMFEKVLGRTGRGLTIIRNTVLRAEGRISFGARGSKLFLNLEFPVEVQVRRGLPSCPSSSSPRRVACFESGALGAFAHDVGLGGFLVEPVSLPSLLEVGEPLELITDFDRPFPAHVFAVITSKRERIQGMARIWNREQKEEHTHGES